MKLIRIVLPLFVFFLLSVIFMRQFSTAGVIAANSSPGNSLLVEYPIPMADSAPRNIVVEAPGRIWFTAENGNSIGRLVVTNTLDYQFTMYNIPTANSQPYDLAFDGSNYIWFTELAGNKIGRLDIGNG